MLGVQGTMKLLVRGFLSGTCADAVDEFLQAEEGKGYNDGEYGEGDQDESHGLRCQEGEEEGDDTADEHGKNDDDETSFILGGHGADLLSRVGQCIVYVTSALNLPLYHSSQQNGRTRPDVAVSPSLFPSLTLQRQTL